MTRLMAMESTKTKNLTVRADFKLFPDMKESGGMTSTMELVKKLGMTTVLSLGFTQMGRKMVLDTTCGQTVTNTVVTGATTR